MTVEEQIKEHEKDIRQLILSTSESGKPHSEIKRIMNNIRDKREKIKKLKREL